MSLYVSNLASVFSHALDYLPRVDYRATDMFLLFAAYSANLSVSLPGIVAIYVAISYKNVTNPAWVTARIVTKPSTASPPAFRALHA